MALGGLTGDEWDRMPSETAA